MSDTPGRAESLLSLHWKQNWQANKQVKHKACAHIQFLDAIPGRSVAQCTKSGREPLLGTQASSHRFCTLLKAN